MRYLIGLAVLFCSLLAAQPNSPPVPEDYRERILDLERRATQDPENVEILDALAGSYAMGGRYADAIRVLRKLIVLDADGDARFRLANVYAWSGETDEALKELRALGDRGGTRAVALECKLLTWKEDAEAAQACYAKLRVLGMHEPEQRKSAQLGLARNLAWSGKAGPAIRAYREYYQLAPKDRAATLEFVRLLCNVGRYSEGERVISSLLESEPEDAMALSLKSELLHWAGHRSHEASNLAARAIALEPDLPEARLAAAYALNDLGDRRGATEMFRALQTHVRASGAEKQKAYWGGYEYLRDRVPVWGRMRVVLPFTQYNDTDGIHDSTRSAYVTAPIGNHAVSFSAQEYRSSANTDSIFSFEFPIDTVRLLSGGPVVHLGRDLQVEASGGVASYRRGFTRAVFSTGFSGSPFDRWFFRFRAHRDIIPVTPRSIAIGLTATVFEAGAEYHFDSRTSVHLESGRGFWSDGNKSVTGDFRIQRALRYSRRFAIDAGPRVRTEAFARYMTPQSGIFTPEFYQCYEGFLGVHGEIGNHVVYEVRSGLGAQRVTGWSDFQMSAEVSSSLVLNVSQALSISGSYTRRNYNLVSGFGSYQGFYVQLGVRP